MKGAETFDEVTGEQEDHAQGEWDLGTLDVSKLKRTSKKDPRETSQDTLR